MTLKAALTMAKYSDIQNAEQLQAAIDALRQDAEAQRKVLEKDYRHIRSALKPVESVSGIFSKGRKLFNWGTVALTLLSRLKRRK